MAVLGPHVSAQYLVMLISRTLQDTIQKSDDLIEKKGSFEMLEVLHHLTAGFKAYWCEYAYIAMDDMRQACGGAGFHLASGIASTW